jgi:hypothetical protein
MADSQQQPRLLDQVRTAIRVRHYSRRTEEAYVHWIGKFILYHGKRHPSLMREPEIGAFISALATEGRVSASTQNQALSAVVFLYREVLRVELANLPALPRAVMPVRVPVVLTPSEVRHPDGAGAAVACGCQHDDDLHTRAESWRPWRGEPPRSPMTCLAASVSQSNVAHYQGRGHVRLQSPRSLIPPSQPNVGRRSKPACEDARDQRIGVDAEKLAPN